jgi:hypothetical protein
LQVREVEGHRVRAVQLNELAVTNPEILGAGVAVSDPAGQAPGG